MIAQIIPFPVKRDRWETIREHSWNLVRSQWPDASEAWQTAKVESFVEVFKRLGADFARMGP